MFLFTTPPEPPAGAPVAAIVRPVEPARPGAFPQAASGPVVDAIRQGAERTGTDFGYLLQTARRESALDPTAKAPTSSATGLFQFIEQTWLGLIKSEGDKVGLGTLAEAISPRASGGFAVDDAGTRDAILKLREDPSLSSVMAGTLTQQNRDALAAAIGHEPGPGELYMAHLLGARGAADLIRSAEATPNRPAALDLADAAAANRSIFYDRDGRARGAAEVQYLLSVAQPAAPQPATTASAAVPAPAVEPAALPFRPTGPVLYSLFQTENRGGPISTAVAKVWRANNTATNAVAASYFPRTGLGQTVTAEAVIPLTAAADPIAAPASAGAAAWAPLPPPRPRDLARSDAGPRRASRRTALAAR